MASGSAPSSSSSRDTPVAQPPMSIAAKGALRKRKVNASQGYGSATFGALQQPGPTSSFRDRGRPLTEADAALSSLATPWPDGRFEDLGYTDPDWSWLIDAQDEVTIGITPSPSSPTGS